MTEEVLLAHIKHACQTCKGRQAILWHASGYDDRLHLNRLGAVERLLDVTVGGVVNIENQQWRLHEGKQKGEPGIVVWLEKVNADQADTPAPQEGMIVTNRPKTAADWKAWQLARMQEKGIQPVKPKPDNYPQARGGYTMDWLGALDAEGIKS